MGRAPVSHAKEGLDAGGAEGSRSNRRLLVWITAIFPQPRFRGPGHPWWSSHPYSEQRHASVAPCDSTELQGNAHSFRMIGDDGHCENLVYSRVQERAGAERRDECDLPAVASHCECAACNDADRARDRKHLRAKEAVRVCACLAWCTCACSRREHARESARARTSAIAADISSVAPAPTSAPAPSPVVSFSSSSSDDTIA